MSLAKSVLCISDMSLVSSFHVSASCCSFFSASSALIWMSLGTDLWCKGRMSGLRSPRLTTFSLSLLYSSESLSSCFKRVRASEMSEIPNFARVFVNTVFGLRPNCASKCDLLIYRHFAILNLCKIFVRAACMSD